MLDSASGMSITRWAPKRCWRPSVALKTPPLRPTSCPSTQTRSSRSISSKSASRTAWTSVRSGIGIHVTAERPRFGLRGTLRRLGGTLDLPIDLVTHRLIGFQRQPTAAHQRVAHAWNGILQGFRRELRRVAVRPLVVVGGVRLQAQDLGFDQGRTTAGPCPLRRLGHGRVDGEEVIAGNPNARNAVGGRSFRDAGSSDLQRLRHRDRPVIVLAEEDHRTAVDAGKVKPSVKAPRAVAPSPKLT